MRCPSLRDLPTPSPHRCGWPWTEESPQRPDAAPADRPWPRISIVTPSYNQGQFIEETIRSVLLQGYPDLEYIVIDGGSTDHTVEIIQRYEPWLSYWVSEKDHGQSHAINKGMAQATGDIVAWLNSDDLYLPSALAHVGGVWERDHTHWLVGKILAGETLDDPDIQTYRISSAASFLEIAAFWLVRERNLRSFTQPEVFLSRQAWNAVGGVYERLNLLMDYHLWTKLAAAGYRPQYVPELLSFFRLHASQKTQPGNRGYNWQAAPERAWSLYDAIRRARHVTPAPPDLEEVTTLLERKAGGYCRVLDVSYRDGGLSKMLATAAWNAFLRPATTLRYTPRNIIKRCLQDQRSRQSEA